MEPRDPDLESAKQVDKTPRYAVAIIALFVGMTLAAPISMADPHEEDDSGEVTSGVDCDDGETEVDTDGDLVTDACLLLTAVMGAVGISPGNATEAHEELVEAGSGSDSTASWTVPINAFIAKDQTNPYELVAWDNHGTFDVTMRIIDDGTSTYRLTTEHGNMVEQVSEDTFLVKFPAGKNHAHLLVESTATSADVEQSRISFNVLPDSKADYITTQPEYTVRTTHAQGRYAVFY